MALDTIAFNTIQRERIKDAMPTKAGDVSSAPSYARSMLVNSVMVVLFVTFIMNGVLNLSTGRVTLPIVLRIKINE